MILLNGPDGCDCVLTWTNPGIGGVVDPVYNELSGASVPGTLTTRCHVNKMFSAGEIKGKNLVDVIAGDAIVLFPKALDLTGKGNLIFAIQSLGKWRLVETPPLSSESYSRLIVNGESFVQACYMRRVSTT